MHSQLLLVCVIPGAGLILIIHINYILQPQLQFLLGKHIYEKNTILSTLYLK